MCCDTERTYEVLEIIADILVIEFLCRGTDYLEDDLDSAFFAVIACYREGDALAVSINAEDDELTGFCFRSDQGSFDLHHGNCGIKADLFHDFVHASVSF